MDSLRSPAELASLTHRNYIAELNAAGDKDLLDWTGTDEGFVTEVGRLKLVVAHNAALGRWEWKLLHERGGLKSNGHSESREVAKQEAVAYAIHFVRHGMTGLLS